MNDKTKSTVQRVLDFGCRLDKLVLSGKMSAEARDSIIKHLRASLEYGKTEIDSHERMTDDQLCRYAR